MIAFLVILAVLYMAAGNKGRRAASGQAVRAARSSSRTAAQNTWTKRRPDRSDSRQRISDWWSQTPKRRAVRTAGRSARTGGHLLGAGVLAGTSGLGAAVRNGGSTWVETRREQKQQRQAGQPVQPSDLDGQPEDSPPTAVLRSVRTSPAQAPELSTPDSSDRSEADIWQDPEPSGQTICEVAKSGDYGRPTTRYHCKYLVLGQGDMFRVCGTPTTRSDQFCETHASIAPTTKESTMTAGPGEINDLTTTITELETVDTELLESELWPILESWASGSDLFSRHLGDDTHVATDEVAEAIQRMLEDREVVLDAVEAAIQEAKTTIGDAA